MKTARLPTRGDCSARPAKKDGLYWETQPGEPDSPLGPAGRTKAQIGAKEGDGYGVIATGCSMARDGRQGRRLQLSRQWPHDWRFGVIPGRSPSRHGRG